MTLAIGLSLLAIFLLLLLSAFFSGSETALTAVSRARMHALEEEGNARAAVVNRLLAKPEKMLSTVLLGNTFVDALAAALAASIAVKIYGDVGVAVATVALTMLIVIFGAILPKTYAIAFSDRFSLAVAPVMQALMTILRPFTRLLEVIVGGLLRMTPSKVDDQANIIAAHEEIRGTIDLSAKEGTVAKGDAEMLGGVLDLRDLQVADIMVHRTKMETVDADAAPELTLDSLLKSQFTRAPIWKDEPENFIGVLHVKDLIAGLARVNWDISKLDIMSYATDPWFVPDTTSVKDQLNAFLKRQAQMALVVDEYGEVQGLITLEDILEEIVGQISDEHDTQDTHIRPQPDGTVNVDGTVAIRDLNRHLDWDLPDDEATTIAGLVIHEAQSIPEPGQIFTFHGYRFEILRKMRNKITAVRVMPVSESLSGTGENGPLPGKDGPALTQARN